MLMLLHTLSPESLIVLGLAIPIIAIWKMKSNDTNRKKDK